MSAELQRHMQAAWQPTDKQIALAEAALQASPETKYAYTLHLLLEKSYGVWTDDVAVVALDGVFTDRATALAALKALSEQFHDATGRPLTAGWTTHFNNGQWAVFEDICSELPKRVTT